MFHKEHCSTSSGKGKKAKDVPLRKSDRRALRQCVGPILSSSTQEEEELVDEIFLQGSLVSRQVQVADIKATLFFRSANQRNQADESSSLLWPFTTFPQCVWIQLDSKDHWQDAKTGKAVVLNVPTLPLLSSLIGLSSDRKALIPTVTVPAQVSKYLCRGAHLMRAGMRGWILPEGYSEKSSLQQPCIIAVQVQGNPRPFAVGILASDLRPGSSNFGSTGVGVTIVTCYGDDLWRQQLPKKADTENIFDNGDYGNEGFLQGKYVMSLVDSDEKSESEGEEDTVDQDTQQVDYEPSNRVSDDAGAEEGDYSIENHKIQQVPELARDSGEAQDKQIAEQEEPSSSELSPEEVLHAAVCRALIQIQPKKHLPMLISTFYSQFVLPNRPPGTTIELKRTRYKKFGPYLTEQVDAGLLTVGADIKTNNAMAFLTGFNKRHDDLQIYLNNESLAPLAKPIDTNDQQKLVLTKLYVLPARFTSLLQLDPGLVKAEHATSPERQGTGMLTMKEINKMLDDYIVREDLVDPAHPALVILDGPLTDALFGNKKDQPQTVPEQLSRKDLKNKWTSKMEEAYALVELPGSRVIKLGRGKRPVVTIEVTRRSNRKFVTHVRGLAHYAIDSADFCKDVSHRFACSGSMEEIVSSKVGPASRAVELIFQGNLADELEALLLGDEKLSSHGGARNSPYRLPKDALDFQLRKGVPARKKK